MKTITSLAIEVVDNKELDFAMSQPEPGYACNSCIYYGLPHVINEDTPTHRDPTFHDMTDEERSLVLKINPVKEGYCTNLLPQGVLVVNVPSTHGCPRFIEKPLVEQFYDDMITDDNDPYQGPLT